MSRSTLCNLHSGPPTSLSSSSSPPIWHGFNQNAFSATEDAPSECFQSMHSPSVHRWGPLQHLRHCDALLVRRAAFLWGLYSEARRTLDICPREEQPPILIFVPATRLRCIQHILRMRGRWCTRVILSTTCELLDCSALRHKFLDWSI